MNKQVTKAHIAGEAGVIQFAKYCNTHKPYIIWRETAKNDFGIDGEVELTRINEERKIEPTSEIIKIQIKTNSSDKSYIRNETTYSFDFYPRKEDVEYWAQYKKNGLEVILVIFDDRNASLYAKKLTDIDLFIGKSQVKDSIKRPNAAITFDKTGNLLDPEKSDFLQRFTDSFKSRVAFGLTETITSNQLRYLAPPKTMYAYPAKLTNKKSIFETITREDAPYFTIYKSTIYTFISLGAAFSVFKEKVLSGNEPHVILYTDILSDRSLRNHYAELLNEYLKDFFWSKKLAFQKDLGRFYFRLPPNETGLSVQTTTRKRGQESQKAVVKRFEYPAYSFYRHIALEVRHQFVGQDIYLVILPKYFFSEDGRKPLEGKLVTKLTNFLTSQEFNNHYCDWLHFWWEYLSKGIKEIVVFEDAAYRGLETIQSRQFYATHLRITLSYYQEFNVDFGIADDIKERKKKETPESPSTQTNLF